MAAAACHTSVIRWDVLADRFGIFRPFDYRGKHPATFPPELVRRILAASCDDDAVVLDPLGGAGTVALVALQMGHRAITIDNNPDYTEEARQRIANARAFVEADNDDEGTAVSRWPLIRCITSPSSRLVRHQTTATG